MFNLATLLTHLSILSCDMRDVEYKPSHTVGSLVKVEIDKSQKHDLEFVTYWCERKGWVRLFEKIDLRTFPSSNDFHGREVLVPDGTVGIVVGVVGVPDYVLTYLMTRKEEAPPTHRLIRNDLTVYTLLIDGCEFQVFGCDIKAKRC